MTDDEDYTQDNTMINDTRNDKKTDFETKNLERLREMQEKRKQDQQMVEEARLKM